MIKANSTTMGIFGPCRLSYLTVFKPRPNMNGEDEYSVTLLIPKTPTEQCPDAPEVVTFVAGLIKAAAAEEFGEGVKYERPMKDGDKEEDSEGNPKHPGFWFVRAKCKPDYPPLVIDGNRKPVKGGWNSGDWGITQVSFYGYDYKGKKGVSAGLRAIQFTHKDEPFGAPATSADDFDIIEGAHTGADDYGTPPDSEEDPFAG